MSKIVKARPLDNLEMLQFMRHYVTVTTKGAALPPYPAAERRAAAKGGAAAKRPASAAPGPDRKSVV